MIRAVIFDMFETLITHYESPLYMGKQICADIGIDEPKFREIWDATEADRTLGRTTLEEVIGQILRVNDRYSDKLFREIIDKRRNSKIECFRHLCSGIIPMLEAIKGQNIKIGLITNCYFEESEVIRESILFKYFDSVCMSCELGMKKPDTAIFKRCMEEMNVSAQECIYVGDGGSFELETARHIGMQPIQAVWYMKEGIKQPSQRNADFLQAESPEDILSEIEKYNKL